MRQQHSPEMWAALTPLMYFASRAHLDHLPSVVRSPLSAAEWMAESSSGRRRVIVNFVHRVFEQRADAPQYLAEIQAAGDRAARAAEKRAKAELPASVEERPPAPAEVLARYYVSCAAGCGTMLPVRGPRPVVRLCSAATRRSGRGERVAKLRIEPTTVLPGAGRTGGTGSPHAPRASAPRGRSGRGRLVCGA